MMREPPRINGIRRVVDLGRRSIDDAVSDEIAFHMQSRIDELRAAGYSAEDAQRVASAEYGNVDESRRELAAIDRDRRRRVRNGALFNGLGLDLRHALRSLRRNPGFVLAAVLTFTLGIGAAASIFSLVDTVLLRPLPYRDPQRLVGAWHNMPRVNLPRAPQAVQTYFTYRTLAHSIEGIGLYREASANVSVPGDATDPKRLTIASCTASLFTVLGVQAKIGRAFSEEEDRPGGPPVVVISDDFWRFSLGGDPNAVGRMLDVNGVTRQIVGVMPTSLQLPSARTALWIPLNLDRANPPASAFTYTGIARLKAGVAISDAERDFAAVLPRVTDLFTRFVPGITMREIMDQTRPQPFLTHLSDDVTGGVARTLWVMCAAAVIVFLVACVNVGNLALVRFDARRRELGLRQALGASAGRVARCYVTELALAAALATFAALLIQFFALRLLVNKGPADIPRLAELRFDARAMLPGLLLGALAVVLSGSIPVLRLLRGHLALREASRGATASRRDNRTRRVLVGAQVAFALVVLAGSALLFRSFQRLQAVRPGFDARRVATAWVSLPPARYAGDSAIVRFYENLLDHVRAIPGVSAAGLTSRLPLVPRGFNDNPLYPEGAVTADSKLPPLQLFTTVGGDYFRAIGIPLLSGKYFDPMVVQREGDAIVSRHTAEMFWHDSTGRSVVGKRFRVLPTSRWYTIVGVVTDAHDSSLAIRASPTVYFPETIYTDPAQRQTTRTMAVVLDVTGDPISYTASVQRAVHDLDPALPVFDVQPMSVAVSASTNRLRLTVITLAAAALVTLLLGALGLYGVLAYVVSLRRRELGIRIALGATPTAVAAATAREGLVIAGVGVLVGTGLFTIAARSLRSLLFGVTATDPLSVAAAAGVLVATALLSTLLPARHAAAVDPAEALRSD